MNYISNRKARYEYHILDEYDAGIMLNGTEVKSIRNSDATINDSFVYIKDGEVYIKNFKVSNYKQAYKGQEHDINRDKKLLLNKREISKISKKLQIKGNSCVPLKVFTSNNKIKIKIAVVKGKKLWDKKQSIKERDIDRDMKRNL
jgi:SsrA-binding protein